MKVPSIKSLISESNIIKRIGKKARTAVVATSVAAAPVGVTSCGPAMYATHGVQYGTVVTHAPATVVVPSTTYYNPAWSYGYWMGYYSAPRPVLAPPPKPAPKHIHKPNPKPAPHPTPRPNPRPNPKPAPNPIPNPTPRPHQNIHLK